MTKFVDFCENCGKYEYVDTLTGLCYYCANKRKSIEEICDETKKKRERALK